jgi:hypothetical protein
MPDDPALMHATQAARPFHTTGWVYEDKGFSVRRMDTRLPIPREVPKRIASNWFADNAIPVIPAIA